MPQTITKIKKPSLFESQELKIIKPKNIDDVIVWKNIARSMSEFAWLLENEPLRSVVIEIHPDVARVLLKMTNKRNRKIKNRNTSKLLKAINESDYELTGDTIKFNKSGHLIDGQHRMYSCSESGNPLTTHVVFGLNNSVFDVLDEGSKRKASDVLYTHGINNATVVAGAIHWLEFMTNKSNKTIKQQRSVTLTNRQTLKLYRTKYKGIEKYAKEITMALKTLRISPSFLLALYWVISKKGSQAIAKEFYDSWTYGPYVGRGEGFTNYAKRLINIEARSGTKVHAQVKSVLAIKLFNCWQDNKVATHRHLNIHKDDSFPTVVIGTYMG